MVPLTFADPADYDKIEEDDRISVLTLPPGHRTHALTQAGSDVSVESLSTSPTRPQRNVPGDHCVGSAR